jgi:hypothetical protein
MGTKQQKALFPTKGSRGALLGVTARRRRSVEPRTATEDKKHETSLDRRRHGRGLRDRRSRLGPDHSRSHDSIIARTRAVNFDADPEKAYASPHHAPSRSRLPRRRGPDDGTAQPAGAATHHGRWRDAGHSDPCSGHERTTTAAEVKFETGHPVQRKGAPAPLMLFGEARSPVS